MLLLTFYCGNGFVQYVCACQNQLYSPSKFAQPRNLLWQEGAYGKHIRVNIKCSMYLSISLTLSHSLYHTHTHFLSLPMFFYLSLSLSLSLTHTGTVSDGTQPE